MAMALWLFAGLIAFFFAYNMHFTQATLSFGQELAETSSGTGFQDAITPPWQTNFAMFSYIGVVAAIVTIWWQLGWLSGLGAIALILIGGGIVGVLLPDKDSPHFRKLIIGSMIARYADYARDGDQMRAESMKDLLVRAGIDPDARLPTQT